MLLSHERSLQPGLVGAGLIVPVAGLIGSYRHQLNIQRRHVPKRVAFSAVDRLIFVGLYRLVPNAIKGLTIVKPDTVIRRHRAGFRSYWEGASQSWCSPAGESPDRVSPSKAPEERVLREPTATPATKRTQ